MKLEVKYRTHYTLLNTERLLRRVHSLARQHKKFIFDLKIIKHQNQLTTGHGETSHSH